MLDSSKQSFFQQLEESSDLELTNSKMDIIKIAICILRLIMNNLEKVSHETIVFMRGRYPLMK